MPTLKSARQAHRSRTLVNDVIHGQYSWSRWLFGDGEWRNMVAAEIQYRVTDTHGNTSLVSYCTGDFQIDFPYLDLCPLTDHYYAPRTFGTQLRVATNRLVENHFGYSYETPELHSRRPLHQFSSSPLAYYIAEEFGMRLYDRPGDFIFARNFLITCPSYIARSAINKLLNTWSVPVLTEVVK